MNKKWLFGNTLFYSVLIPCYILL